MQRFVLAKRSYSAISVAGVLLVLLLSYLLSIAWQRQSLNNYIESRARIIVLKDQDLGWQFSKVVADSGSEPTGLYRHLQSSLQSWNGLSVQSTQISNDGVKFGDRGALLARLQISHNHWDPLLVLDRDLVVAIPYLEYKRVNVYVNGRYEGLYLSSSRVGIPFDPAKYSDSALTIDLLFQDTDGASEIFKYMDEPVFVATAGEYHGFLRFSALGENTKLTWLSDTSVIIMAIFLLILFLFVDSSSETLGVALYLGFSAFSISVDYGWLPFIQRAWIGVYAAEMSAIFRFYYILQLSRVTSGRVWPWFIFGNLIAIPYAYLTTVVFSYSSDWVDAIESAQDLIFCLVSVTICLRVAVHLYGKKVPWRIAALIFAALSSLQQIMIPLEWVFPALSSSQSYSDWYYIAKHLSVFLLAISAFVNISSLENRVRILSSFQAKQQVMTKELELAQEVQTAFMSIPDIPPTFDLLTQHDGQLQVSGDSYYVSWDKQRDTLTVLLNDVTGHGIQAALKASVCQVIAKLIWEDFERSKGIPSSESYIRMYEKRLRQFFSSVNDSPDVVAFVGCEINQHTGRAEIYRANFTFPFLISPREDEAIDVTEPTSEKGYWKIDLLSVKHQEPTYFQLKNGSFLMFMSDGYIAGSRDAYAVLKLMTQKLAPFGAELASSDLKTIIRNDPRLNRPEVDDDRTFVIVQWKP